MGGCSGYVKLYKKKTKLTSKQDHHMRLKTDNDTYSTPSSTENNISSMWAHTLSNSHSRNQKKKDTNWKKSSENGGRPNKKKQKKKIIIQHIQKIYTEKKRNKQETQGAKLNNTTDINKTS